MESLEKKKNVRLSLNLPLIEIDNLNVCKIENYEKSGVFFVKTPDGLIYLIDVDINNGVLLQECLPMNVINLLIEQQTATSIVEQMEEKLNRLEEVVHSARQEPIVCVEHNCKNPASKIDALLDTIEEERVGIQSIPQTTVKLLGEQQPQGAGSLGYVSQETLVEILRTVK